MATDVQAVEARGRRLFATLRRHLESGRPFTWEQAARASAGFLLRELPARDRTTSEALEATLHALARHMGEPTDAGVLEAFCLAASEAAVPRRPPPRHPGAALSGRTIDLDDKERLVRSALYAEYASAQSDDDLVHRAVTRALRERRRGRRGERKLDLSEDDPLRKLLDVPARGPVWVRRGDVRGAMTDHLGGLLRQAAPFAEGALRPILGEELWGLCRPTGFGDTRREQLVVRVASSALAQEVQMRRVELLDRIRRVPGFEKVKTLRFVVADPPR